MNTTLKGLPTLLFFFLILGSSQAQSGPETVIVDAKLRRQVITAYTQDQIINIQHLDAGKTYVFVIPPDRTLSTCMPGISLMKSTAEFIQYDAAKHLLRFKAGASNVQINLHYPCSWEQSNPPRHYVSVFCQDCNPKKLTNPFADLSVLEVENAGAEELVRDIFIGGDCFDVTNVSFSGNGAYIGKFSQGLSNIGFDKGVILCTGDINVAPGPNNQFGAGNGGAGGSDPDLGGIASGNMFDVTVLEFDFTPTKPQLDFSYVFASEEYCEYVNTGFNDVFGFFISGPGFVGTQNIAFVPLTNVPVSINTINHVVNSALYVPNTPAGQDNCETGGISGTLPPQPVATGIATQEVQYDGFTQKMIALANLVPCSTYHIKLAIADVADGVWDSAVFLKANSFDAGGDALAFAAYQAGQESAIEGCAQGEIHFARGNGDLTLPITVNFTVSGASTATAGLDYEPLVSPVIIPVGQTEVVVPVNVYSDNLTEGQEFFRLLIDNNCKCQQGQVDFLIVDNELFSATVLQDTTICEGFSTPLFVLVDGGIEPYTYAWSSGDTTQAFLVSPATSTLYTVTVTDACGGTATDDALVEVIPIIRDTVNLVICSGGSITLNGVVYTSGATVADTSYQTFFCGEITTYVISSSQPLIGADTIPICAGGSVEIAGTVYTESGTVVDTLSTAADCDSIVTYTLVVLPPFTGSDTLSFCAGSSIEIGDSLYTEAGTVIDTLSTATGCDSIVTYTLIQLPLAFGADTISFCSGDTVFVAGNFYSESAVVLDTLAAGSGCDSIVKHTLIRLPLPTRIESISFCPGESVLLGGVTYTQDTVVTLTIPGIIGCDTVVTYKLDVLPQPTRTETIKFCPGDSVTLGGTVYTQPGVVVLTLAAATGCDTIATYTLEFLTPAPSTVSIVCPNSISMNVPSGASGAVVTFAAATATSDCPCPGIVTVQSSGLASGSTFPIGVSQICYRANDVCGQTASCCFNVSVEEENACDTKVIGCMKYELLTITQDQYKNKTYRIRVTNNCSNELVYTAVQLPSSVVALFPDNNSIYTAPSGNDYLVRNPNFSPFYSVRYQSVGTGIANGESDILRYTLPAQADVLFIHITTRLSIQVFYEAHLNTFYCPIGVTPPEEQGYERSSETGYDLASVFVFPNPSEGFINVDLAAWEGEKVQMQVFNSQGQRVFLNSTIATMETQRIDLPQGIADGLYILDLTTENGEREVIKFVVKH